MIPPELRSCPRNYAEEREESPITPNQLSHDSHFQVWSMHKSWEIVLPLLLDKIQKIR